MEWFGFNVVANIPDSKGDSCGHPHTAMVLRGPASDGSLWLIAISSSYNPPNTNRWWIELNGLWAPGGHPITGLMKPCVLKCDWVVSFNRKDLVDEYIGYMPPDIASRASDLAVQYWQRSQKAE